MQRRVIAKRQDTYTSRHPKLCTLNAPLYTGLTISRISKAVSKQDCMQHIIVPFHAKFRLYAWVHHFAPFLD